MLKVARVLSAVILLAGSLDASPSGRPATAPRRTAFDCLEAELETKVLSEEPLAEKATHRRLLNQMRNHQAMAELLSTIPLSKRPRRILYAASGDHMAPLVACLADSGQAPYEFYYTEIDLGCQEGIERFLRFLVQKEVASRLSCDPVVTAAPAKRVWRFTLAGHAVTLTLVLDTKPTSKGTDRPYPLWALAASDLVISHDWSGDQIENLRFIWELLRAVRISRRSTAPLLMIEDLEAHPYPVDMEFFAPLARTNQPYGHRKALEADRTLAPDIELGTALYGGGTLLSFEEPWWRKLDEPSLTAAFNFLLFNEFDGERINVLEGGPSPVLAPALLDWALGYGSRAIGGEGGRANAATKNAMAAAAASAATLMPPHLMERWTCRMVLFLCLVELEAAGASVEELMPTSKYPRRAGGAGLPISDPAMARAYRDVAANALSVESARRAEVREDSNSLRPALRAVAYRDQARRCLRNPDTRWPPDSNGWFELYRSTKTYLEEPCR